MTGKTISAHSRLVIDRISLKLVCDALFVSIDGVEKRLRTPDYRTLTIHQWQTSRRKNVLNIVQLKRPAAMQKIALQYPDEAQTIAVSMAETLMEEFEFGFGDIREGAPYLVLEHDRVGSAAKLVKWLKKNAQGDVLTVEGSKRTRVSFDNENDFVLTRINFS